MKTLADLKVGDTVWLFDSNRRVYVERNAGPTWTGHWRKCTVTSETTRSFIIDGDSRWRSWKIAKKGRVTLPHGCRAYALDQDGIERMWLLESRWKIGERIRGIDDIDTLVKIAELIGFDRRVDLSELGKA